MAIEQQVVEVVNLASRMAKLDWTLNTTITDMDLPETNSALDITPRVAAATAAALNAERITQKMKMALLNRKETSLNTKVASAVTFEITKQNGMAHVPLGSDLLSLRPSQPQTSLQSQSSLPKRRKAGSGGVKHHSKPILLKGSLAVASTLTPSFDWGPLPSITPMTTISVDVRTKHDT
jgi:nucleoporin NUP159